MNLIRMLNIKVNTPIVIKTHQNLYIFFSFELGLIFKNIPSDIKIIDK